MGFADTRETNHLDKFLAFLQKISSDAELQETREEEQQQQQVTDTSLKEMCIISTIDSYGNTAQQVVLRTPIELVKEQVSLSSYYRYKERIRSAYLNREGVS